MKFPYLKEAIKSVFRKPSTEIYPKVNKEAPEGYRGKINYYPEKCVNCGMCIRVCAPGCITRTIEKTEEGDKITFNFYQGQCTFCSLCADFCPRGAIELTKNYHLAVTDEKDLLVSGTFIKKLPPKPPVQPQQQPLNQQNQVATKTE